MDGASRFYSAWGPVANGKHEFDTGGIGQYIADYIAGRMYRRFLGINRAVILAAYVLSQAKENVEGCGVDTHIAVLRDRGASGRVDWKRVEVITDLLKAIDEVIGDVILGSADFSTAIKPGDVQNLVNPFITMTETYRNNAKEEIERAEGLRRILAGEQDRDFLGLFPSLLKSMKIKYSGPRITGKKFPVSLMQASESVQC